MHKPTYSVCFCLCPVQDQRVLITRCRQKNIPGLYRIEGLRYVTENPLLVTPICTSLVLTVSLHRDQPSQTPDSERACCSQLFPRRNISPSKLLYSNIATESSGGIGSLTGGGGEKPLEESAEATLIPNNAGAM